MDASIDRTVRSIVGRADLRVSAFAETGLSSGDGHGARRRARRGAHGAGHRAAQLHRLRARPPDHDRARHRAGHRPGPRAARPRPPAGPGRAPRRGRRGRGAHHRAPRGVGGAGRRQRARDLRRRRARPCHAWSASSPATARRSAGPAGRSCCRSAPAARLNRADDAAPRPTQPSRPGSRAWTWCSPPGPTRTTVDRLHRRRPSSMEPYVLSAPRDIGDSMRASTADLRATMALMAAIALFAAAFMILNTLAMTVVERVRELALLRAAGAGRGQVVRVVLAQALVLGFAGSAVGLILGAVLAEVVAAWLRAAGTANVDGPAISPVVLADGSRRRRADHARRLDRAGQACGRRQPRRRAPRPVRPGGARPGRTRAGWSSWSSLIGALALTLLPAGHDAACAGPAAGRGRLRDPAGRRPPDAGAARPRSGASSGLPFAAVLRLEERLARAAISRDRGRTTLTVGALVVGLAMVVGLGTRRGERPRGRHGLARGRGARRRHPDGDRARADGPRQRRRRAGRGRRRARSRPRWPPSTSPTRGTRLDAMAIRGHDFEADGRLTFTAGDRGQAFTAIDAGGAVILPRARAQALGVGVGDVMAVATSAGLVELEVAGIVDRSFPGRTGEAVARRLAGRDGPVRDPGRGQHSPSATPRAARRRRRWPSRRSRGSGR